ncbi:hypothetical protein ACFXJ8_28135 [Nonomuraea sp. NPDC059194]
MIINLAEMRAEFAAANPADAIWCLALVEAALPGGVAYQDRF